VLTEKHIQEALLKMGQCSQGFDWNERDQMQPCCCLVCGAVLLGMCRVWRKLVAWLYLISAEQQAIW
jgi:hypothetical protein